MGTLRLRSGQAPALHWETLNDHRARRIVAITTDREGEWAIKFYGVEGLQRPISNELLESARRIAEQVLRNRKGYGVAFVIIHEAAFNTVVVDWWEQTNELRHHVFRAMPDAPLSFVNITASGESVCTWELRIQAFERERWIEYLTGSRDLQSYVASVLTTGIEP